MPATASARKTITAPNQPTELVTCAVSDNLLHVLAHPDLRPSAMHRWHAQLPFAPIAHGLAARFRRMRADGLIAATDAEAAARTLLAVAHSVALLAVLMNEEHEAQRSARLRAMVDVVWSGLAPAAPVRS